MENLKNWEEDLQWFLAAKPGVTLVLVGTYKTSAFRICVCNLGFVPVICSVMTVLIFLGSVGDVRVCCFT